MDTKSRLASKKANSSKMLGVSAIFRDENNQLKMIFDKEDGSQTIKGNRKLDQLQNLKFAPGTIKSPSRDLQASVYASVHNYVDYSTPGYRQEPDNDSMISDILFAASDNFSGFAKKHFQITNPSPDCYYNRPLTVSLLPPKDKSVHLAALASWVTILKIMGDLQGPDKKSGKDIDSRPIPFSFIKENFAKKFTKKEVDDAVKKYTEMVEYPNADYNEIPFLYTGDTMLEQVQFLCCLGMVKNSLRDEIYCQVLKQMTQNPSHNSVSRGWLLLYLIVGVFHPTETLMPCLLAFLRESQFDIASKIEYNLRRALRNGTRSYPPGWTEFQAMKNYKPIFLPVTLMSGERLLVRVDSSTTVKEFCTSIARSLGLKSTMGFSIFATLFEKISYLGDSLHRIMDTICECEYFSKVASINERNSPWRLYFRKEYFPPWETSIKDPVAVDLITAQVLRGITVEEYPLEESQIIYYAALKYYISDEELRVSKLTKLVEKFLPKYCLEKRSSSEWVNLISEIFKQEFQSKNKTKASCMNAVIDFAMKSLRKSFSRLYEIKQFTSPNLKLSQVSGAAHQHGFSIVDVNAEEKLYIPYEEMINLRKKGNWIHIKNVKGVNHAVESSQVDDLFGVLNSFLEELCNNSCVAVAICRCSVIEKDSFSINLTIKNGDLIVLEQPFKFFKDAEFIEGQCLSSNKRGQFSKDVIHPLATINVPDINKLNILASYLKTTEWSQESVGRFYSYSLDEYGKDHLQAPESSVTKLLARTSIRRNGLHEPWKHTKDPIKQPLCRKIQQRADLKYCACKIFHAILTYMEDIKRIEAISDILLATDKIFEIAIRNKHLRNEIYVQLIKQLSENDQAASRNKGWVLMYLLTGCIVPQEDMYQELLKFLQVSESYLAEHCFNRIRTLKVTGTRVYPPHTLEHLSVSSHSIDPIKLEVILSDSSHLKLEVFSHSKVMDVCDTIVSKLGLKYGFGYSLFLKTKQRVIPLSDNDYIMDVLAHIEVYFMSQPVQVKDKSFKFQYMKKLWSLDELREDFEADAIFSYNQDLPNYIAGFHECSVNIAVKLSALIFKTTHENTELDTKTFREVLIPEKFIPTQTKEDWMKRIYCELESIKSMTAKEAKVAYVNIAKEFRTYGSVFFEIQRSEKPNSEQLAINRHEILIIDPVTKETVSSFNYQQLRNWIYDTGKVTFFIDTENSSQEKIYFEIDRFQGELLDDLIISNIEFSLNSKLKNLHGFSSAKIGETHC